MDNNKKDILRLVLVWIGTCKPLWQRGSEKCNNHNDSKAAMLQSAAIYTVVRLSRALSRTTRGLSTFDTRQPAKFKSPDSNFCRRFLCFSLFTVELCCVFVYLCCAFACHVTFDFYLLPFVVFLSISRRKSSDVQTQAK